VRCEIRALGLECQIAHEVDAKIAADAAALFLEPELRIKWA
jgi:hypothetical protein